MSKSFIDAIRSVVTEGAKDKTAGGMTKDAAHFRTDLHTVKDAGFKHLVQKDSETGDYEKMFNGNVDKAADRHGDQRAPEDLNKYVEYNEAVQMAEAKKKAKKDDESSEDENDDENCDVSEAAPVPNPQQRAALDTRLASKSKMAGAGHSPMPQSGTAAAGLFGSQTKMQSAAQNASKMTVGRGQGLSPNASANRRVTGDWQGNAAKDRNDRVMAQRGKVAPSIAADQKAAGKTPQGPQKPAPKNMFRKDFGPAGGFKTPDQAKAQGFNYNIGTHGGVVAKKAPEGTAPKMDTKLKSSPTTEPRDTGVKVVPTSDAPPAQAPVPTARPTDLQTKKPTAKKPQASKPSQAPAKAPAPKAPIGMGNKDGISGSGKPIAPRGGITKKQPAAPAKKASVGMNPLRQSFEIDVNGTSYLVSEAHAAAIAAFVEKHGMVNEGTAGEFIHREMEHPEKLTAKGKKQKIKQALAIYYSKKRRGENP